MISLRGKKNKMQEVFLENKKEFLDKFSNQKVTFDLCKEVNQWFIDNEVKLEHVSPVYSLARSGLEGFSCIFKEENRKYILSVNKSNVKFDEASW